MLSSHGQRICVGHPMLQSPTWFFQFLWDENTMSILLQTLFILISHGVFVITFHSWAFILLYKLKLLYYNLNTCARLLIWITFNVNSNREIHICMVLIFSFSNVVRPPDFHTSYFVVIQSGPGRSNGAQLLFDRGYLGGHFPPATPCP